MIKKNKDSNLRAINKKNKDNNFKAATKKNKDSNLEAVNKKNKDSKTTKKNKILNEKRTLKFLQKFMGKAEKKSDDKKYLKSIEDKSNNLISKSKKLYEKVSGPLKKILNYIKDPKADLLLKIAGVGVIIYLVSPIDALPDFAPVIGFLDDIAAISAFAVIITKNIKSTADSSKETITTVTKSIAEGVTENLNTQVEEQSKIRIKQQLIIAAISLIGAILIALIALLFTLFF